jgi:hypothetical protein
MKIKLNPNNPRIIKDDKFKKLVQSIKDFPEMLDIRPIVVNKDGIILGGNMRFKACLEAGIKEPPYKVVDLTEEQQNEFLIKDNVSGGEWDWDALANEWDVEQLDNWGLDMPNSKEKVEDGEIFFSNELDQVSNYVILKFSTDIDFINIQTLLGLKSTYSKRANGKPWAKGIGRVVDGIDAIIKIKEE